VEQHAISEIHFVLKTLTSQRPAFTAPSVHSNQRSQQPASAATSVHKVQRPQLADFETFLPIGDNNPEPAKHTGKEKETSILFLNFLD
jgi:hypothetical protein